jgi:diguanylate cyclase (GGDEF)-like protein
LLFVVARILNHFDRWVGIEVPTAGNDELQQERFRTLQRQIPWLYAILLVNLVGLISSLAEAELRRAAPGFALAGLVMVRIVYWLRVRQSSLATRDLKVELRKVVAIATLFCSSYCAWSLALFLDGNRYDQIHIVLYASLAAVGCSYGLSSFPFAARLPLLLLAVPIALALLWQSDLAHAGMGCSLIALILLTHRLIDANGEGFERLVHSRVDVERERERAAAAEKVATAEKSRVRRIADTDSLTGIANRRAFVAALDSLSENPQQNIAVALVDLDGFKPINDTFGHETGDALLVEVSRRLQSVIGDPGMVARIGGDEFALLFPSSDSEEAIAICEEAVRQLELPFVLAHRALSISTCVGISFHALTDNDFQQALRQADIALYSAKRSGRGKVRAYSQEIEASLQRTTAIEQALREPAERSSIDLAFQPILDLKTLELQSFEALARWRHSELGWISPSEFIPITERISVVEQLTEELLANAAGQAARWPRHVRLSFNLSAVQLCSLSSAEGVIAIISRCGLEPSRLQIEVTETALLADFRVARANLAYLRSYGVRILLDDFGAGYASISYLREMTFDAIKLDGSLITGALNGSGSALLEGVLGLCHSVGLPCVAEHVETSQQLALLRRIGCQYGQGFGLARPMGADAAEHFAKARRTAKMSVLDGRAA